MAVDTGTFAFVAEMHFERMARGYAGARPPYPRGLFELLHTHGEVEAVAHAADELGGVVTEQYRTVLHLLRRSPIGAENVGGPA